MITILMMSAKMATLGLLKSKSYHILTSIHDITNKILSRDKLYFRCDHVTKVW